jgi:hypothetical protein
LPSPHNKNITSTYLSQPTTPAIHPTSNRDSEESTNKSFKQDKRQRDNMSGVEFTPFIWALPVAVAMLAKVLDGENKNVSDEVREGMQLEEDKERIGVGEIPDRARPEEVTEDSIEVTLEETQS